MPNDEIISDLESVNVVLMDEANEYFIPEFQRQFVWNDENVKELLHDFSEDSKQFSVENKTLEGYLLGNIVLIDNETSGKKIVVDGQQRLTTLSLIAKAIYQVVMGRIEKEPQKASQWFKRLGEMDKCYGIMDGESCVGLRIQHDPNLKFGDYYRKLILDEELTDKDIKNIDDENVSKVYNYAYEIIDEFTDEQLSNFIGYFRTKVKLIVTTAPNEDKAFQLFEILNDRGRSLDAMDLIKNTFLKVLARDKIADDKKQLFINNWNEIMKNLEIDHRRRISATTFLKHFIISEYGVNKNVDQLYRYIKDEQPVLQNSIGILKFVDNMSKKSKHYKEIETGNYSVFGDDQNMKLLYKILGIKQFHPLLMVFYDDTQDNKSKLLDAVVRLGAAVLFSYTQTNYIEKAIPDYITEYKKNLAIDLSGNKDDSEPAAITKLIASINANTGTLAPLVQTNLSKRVFVRNDGELNSKALMILKFVELYFNNNSLVIIPERGKTLTAEHIMSKDLDMTKYSNEELGFESDEERNKYKHRLGNLTLLYNTDNSSLQNAKYSEKLTCYKNSKFVLTTTLVEPKITTVKNGKDTILYRRINYFEKQYASDNGHWTKKLIDLRSEDLSKLIYAILVKDFDEADKSNPDESA